MMDLNWGALGEVAGVSLGVTVAVVVVFSLGVRALAGAAADGVSEFATAQVEAGAADTTPTENARSTGIAENAGEVFGEAGAGARAVAGLCFLACAAVVAYGLYLIIPQFH